MHILIFLHGTILMHPGGVGLSREQIVQQVRDEEASIRDYGAYVPIGNAVHKLQGWASQGATISYLSALTESKLARTDELVDAEALVLTKEYWSDTHFLGAKFIIERVDSIMLKLLSAYCQKYSLRMTVKVLEE